MKRFPLLLNLALIAFVASSCSYRVEKESLPKAKLHANMVFGEIQSEILRPKCARCHDFTGSYEGVASKIEGISVRIQSSSAGFMMPPPSEIPLTPEERDALVSWINRGAPRGGTVEPPPPPPLAPGLYYGYVKQEVFSKKCSLCHDWARAAGAFEQMTPTRLIEMEMRVRSPLGFEQMPPPTSATGPLTTEEKNLLLDWIQAGATKDLIEDEFNNPGDSI